MGTAIIFLAIFMLQSVLSYTDDAYENFDSFTPLEEAEIEAYNDRKTRNDKFLRFGKRLWDYDANNDGYEDSEIRRPPRTGRQEKNDHFIRFGRSKQNYLRFSKNPQQRSARDSSYIRFGRSIKDDTKKSRGKRAVSTSSTENSKRHENYLRFGRNSNFMRFGRDPQNSAHTHSAKDYLLKRLLESRDEPLMTYLRNLMQQSDEMEASEM